MEINLRKHFRKGDRIITNSGEYGEVVAINSNQLAIQIINFQTNERLGMKFIPLKDLMSCYPYQGVKTANMPLKTPIESEAVVGNDKVQLDLLEQFKIANIGRHVTNDELLTCINIYADREYQSLADIPINLLNELLEKYSTQNAKTMIK